MSVKLTVSKIRPHEPKRITTSVATVCPTCHGTTTGIIGKDRYFCADCCTEFTLGHELTVYEISSVGNVFRRHSESYNQLTLFA